MESEKNAFYLAIKFLGSEKSYYFSCPDENFAIGDLVIVMTAAGVEAGLVTMAPLSMSKYNSNLELKSILRKGDERDQREFKRNLEDAKKALAITRKEIANLNLSMDLIDAFYTIDGSRITITYTSPEKRVDFRELLKVLAPQLGCRIELRQIASRDKAKMIGGLGICGLPLCCSTFLNQFEGISIQRAKNQMLTLNIPKLSGPCGKLICCLTYEDDAYTQAKKEFPNLGTTVKLDEGPYTVDSFNIISRNVRLTNATHSDYKTFTLEEFRQLQNGTYQRKVEITKIEESPLPSFGLEKAQDRQHENPRKNDNKNQKKDKNGANPNRNGNAQNNNQKQSNGQQRPQQGGHNNPNQQRGNSQPRNQQNQQRPQNNPQQQKEQNRGNEPRPQKQHHNPNQQRPQNSPNQQRPQNNPNPNQGQANNPEASKNNNHRRYHHHHGHNGNRNNNKGGEGNA
ncbi:MAG: hypothetical protein J6A47_10035 [Bacilli bacterium]|nr:hypothetical protein [Bacilli bacterium]